MALQQRRSDLSTMVGSSETIPKPSEIQEEADEYHLTREFQGVDVIRSDTPETLLPELSITPDISIVCDKCKEHIDLPSLKDHRIYHENLSILKYNGSAKPPTTDALLRRRNGILRKLKSAATTDKPLDPKSIQKVNDAYEYLKSEIDGTFGEFRHIDQGVSTAVKGVALNCSPPCVTAVGICSTRNERWKSYMEDAHVYQDFFGEDRNKCYLALFDGHHGRFAAEIAAAELHHLLLYEMAKFDPRTKAMPRNLGDSQDMFQYQFERPSTKESERVILHDESVNIVQQIINLCEDKYDEIIKEKSLSSDQKEKAHSEEAPKSDDDKTTKTDITGKTPRKKKKEKSIFTIKMEEALKKSYDNAPIFDKPSISLTISEAVLGGTSITIDGARDRDTSDQYSLQSYNVTPSSSPFSIKFLKNLDGTSIVQLVVTQPLDREKQDFYQITVIAKDGGNPPKSGTLQANISISDVNDNSPTFESSSYNITVREDINVSTVIMVVSASDLDKGRNGEVVYRLSPHQEVTNLRHFGINNRTGELSILQPIQYIPGQVYRIIVEASDRGEQPLTSQTFVHVSVIDVGNSRPVITTNLLSGLDIAKISEFADLGAVVAHIAVEDPNSGRNGEIDCWAEADAFTLKRLDAKEFKIVVSESLDREVREQHEVKVMCHDNGNPPLNDSDSFLVIVDDVNDSPPIFSSLSYHEEVYENNAFGEVLVQVHASDSDIGHNAMVLYYSLPDNNFVNVEALSGIIRANMSFDREATPTIKFEVLAIDQGQPALTGTATVTLTIKDINDEPPMFNKPVFTFDISENKHAGTNVAQIVATDRDEGDNSKIAYSIVSGQNQMIPFFLFPNGQIKSDRELDREVQSVYDFIVQAEDLGRPSLNSSARVKVIVTDENDNVPVITAPSTTNNTISLTSNTEIGTRVTIIRAFDLDEKENGLIRYFITQRNDSDLFELNEKTGSLILKRKISQKPGETIVLDIMASDQGKPRLTSTRMLFIQITSPAYYTDTIQRNVIIVIILLAVTAICSGAIIIIICVLRRNDRERKDKEKEIYKQATSLEGGVSVFSLPGDDSSLAEKKKKKEVSFSLDDEDMLQIADPNQLSSKNNNLSLEKPFESKTFPKKQDDDHSIVSGDTNASDSGRGGSDDENHAPKPPHTTSTFHDPIPQKSWFEFQRPQNREMQTFSLHRPGPGSPSTSSKPNSYRDFLPNSVSNVQIHVTAEKTNRPKNGLNNMSFDSGKFSPAPTLDISQDYRDCVV